MLLLVVLALVIPVATSAPRGIGTSANAGCLCHGELNTNTQIEIEGLPEAFESNTTYAFSIEVISVKIPPVEGGEQGGFRLLITDGTIEFNASEGQVQKLDKGWTHTEAGNAVRSWNLTFVSPDDNASYVDFTVYGNAVNANQASSGDQWNSVLFRLPGSSYEGELPSNDANQFSPMDYSVGLVSLVLLSYLLIRTLRN